MSIIAEALKKAQESPPAKTAKKNRDIDRRRKSRKERIKIDFSRLRIYAIFAVSGVAILLFSIALSMLGSVLVKENAADEKKPEENHSYALKADEVKREESTGNASFSPAFITLAEVNEAIRVSGIMYTRQKPLVVINDSIWSEGDIVGKFKITKIERNFIKVNSSGREFIVKLKR